MPRKSGCITEKNCWCVNVTINDTILMHPTEFRTLKEISETLGMTYNQIADISCGRTIKKYSFKFMPTINIEKIIS
jgi:hypothetical protein